MPKSWDSPESEEHKAPYCPKSVGSCLPSPLIAGGKGPYSGTPTLGSSLLRSQFKALSPWGRGRRGPSSYAALCSVKCLVASVCSGGQTPGQRSVARSDQDRALLGETPWSWHGMVPGHPLLLLPVPCDPPAVTSSSWHSPPRSKPAAERMGEQHRRSSHDAHPLLPGTESQCSHTAPQWP